MEAILVYWTPRVNQLKVKCECGFIFATAINRWKIKCPRCKTVGDMHTLRNELAAKDVKLCGGGLH